MTPVDTPTDRHFHHQTGRHEKARGFSSCLPSAPLSPAPLVLRRCRWPLRRAVTHVPLLPPAIAGAAAASAMVTVAWVLQTRPKRQLTAPPHRAGGCAPAKVT